MSFTTTTHPDYLSVYQQRREELIAAARKQLEVVTELAVDDSPTTGDKPGEQLRGVLSRLETDRLRVLVIGRFSSGKSTLINALLGQPVLPAGLKPTTAIVCEIRYSSEKRGLLYRKDDPQNPRVLDDISKLTNDLKQEITIKKGVPSSPYERAELHWPLELCRIGVEIIDTVGLDDPDQRDRITFEQVPNADTVVYCLPGNSAFTAGDRTVLERLKALGYRSMLFVITYYDLVREAVRRGEETETSFRESMSADLAPLTALEENGIRYIDSVMALDGRRLNDERLLEKSGYRSLETALQKFLTEEKGRAKLVASLATLHRVNGLIRDTIPIRISMWQTTASELSARYERAREPLRDLETQRQLILSIVENKTSDFEQQAMRLASDYIDTAQAQVRARVGAYKIEEEIPVFNGGDKIAEIAAKIDASTRDHLSQHVTEWNAKVLAPAVAGRFESVRAAIDEHERTFFASADRVRQQIARGTAAVRPQRENDFAAEEALQLAFGPPGGDGVSVTPVAQAAVGAVVAGTIGLSILGFLTFLNPVTIAGAAIFALVAGTEHAKDKARSRIKEHVADNLIGTLETQRESFIRATANRVMDETHRRRDLLDAALFAEINSIRSEVEAILQQKQSGQANAEREIAALRRLERDNQAIGRELDALLFEARLTA